MARLLRVLLFSFGVLALVLALSWPHRRLLAVRLFALVATSPPLGEAPHESESVEWFDDYFTVEVLDPGTIAIGEPRYWQQNYAYLILGGERAILFDSGPGLRDMEPVVRSLTELPVTAVPSHLHFDHIGNHGRFEGIALVDLPYLRERAGSGTLRPTPGEHLGFVEGFEPPELVVTEWWAPGDRVDLGGRTLEVIHAPGHTPESIALLDRDRGLLFTGDFIYEGPLFALLPGSDLDDYLLGARRLLELAPPGTRLLTGHRETPPGAPVLELGDLADLRATLEGVLDGTLEGEGFYIESFRVNERLRLIAERP